MPRYHPISLRLCRPLNRGWPSSHCRPKHDGPLVRVSAEESHRSEAKRSGRSDTALRRAKAIGCITRAVDRQICDRCFARDDAREDQGARRTLCCPSAMLQLTSRVRRSQPIRRRKPGDMERQRAMPGPWRSHCAPSGMSPGAWDSWRLALGPGTAGRSERLAPGTERLRGARLDRRLGSAQLLRSRQPQRRARRRRRRQHAARPTTVLVAVSASLPRRKPARLRPRRRCVYRRRPAARPAIKPKPRAAALRQRRG